MNIVEIFKVFIISIVEGITEWLPISSTGHMLLLDEFIKLSMSDAFKQMFFVVIQFGAILAVIVLYWKRMLPLKKAHGRVKVDRERVGMWIKILVACIPSAVLGVFLDDILEAHFGKPIIIAVMLIFYGIIFIIVENCNKRRQPTMLTIEDIDFKTAIIIGLFQVLSMIPGTSRSGATIVGGLIIGVSRIAAAEFTFFLAVPTMLGASLLKLVKFGFNFTGNELFVLILGMILSFFVSILAIKFLLGYIKKHDFKVFGWYRIILGLGVIIYFMI